MNKPFKLLLRLFLIAYPSLSFGYDLPALYQKAKTVPKFDMNAVNSFTIDIILDKDNPKSSETHVLKNGETLKVFKGMKILLKSAVRNSGQTVSGINFLGFKPSADSIKDPLTVRNQKHKGANDIGFFVDSVQDLIPKWQVSKNKYAIIVGNQKQIAGAMYLELEEPQFLGASLVVNNKRKFLEPGSTKFVFRTTDAINVTRVKTNVPQNLPIDFKFDVTQNEDTKIKSLVLSFFLGSHRFYRQSFELLNPSQALERGPFKFLLNGNRRL